MQIKQMQREAFANSHVHGFWGESVSKLPIPLTVEAVLCKLALIHSEISEACEDARKGRMELTMKDESDIRDDNTILKPCGFPSELADAIIRIGDLAEALGIDLEDAVSSKMKYNATRPYMHGKKA